MALIKKVRGHSPQYTEDCWFAENATILGEVTMGNECTIWFNAVVRADVNFIKLGNKVNIQDGAVIHCTYEKAGTTIGNNVSIGHNALVHGCDISDNVLIGMGSIVMDNVQVGEYAIVAAGAVVLENTIIEPYTIYAGVPAKKVKTMLPEQAHEIINRTANNYVKYAGWFQEEE